MNPLHAMYVINKMRLEAEHRNLGLLICGSIGYRSALLHTEMLSLCDDIDCIFIYSDIGQLREIPYLKTPFLQYACDCLAEGTVDLFSTKLVLNTIKISADFISDDYMIKLTKEQPEGTSVFRMKLTDSVEKPQNIYCSASGEEQCYNKPCIKCGPYRIYQLPIHWFVNGVYYPGVLLNKMLYNPTALRLNDRQREMLLRIQKNVYSYCKSLKLDTLIEDRVYLTSCRKEYFSKETVNFLKCQE